MASRQSSLARRLCSADTATRCGSTSSPLCSALLCSARLRVQSHWAPPVNTLIWLCSCYLMSRASWGSKQGQSLKLQASFASDRPGSSSWETRGPRGERRDSGGQAAGSARVVAGSTRGSPPAPSGFIPCQLALADLATDSTMDWLMGWVQTAKLHSWAALCPVTGRLRCLSRCWLQIHLSVADTSTASVTQVHRLLSGTSAH